MRISLFCGATYMSGMEIMALAIARGLKGRGHDVTCVVNGWNDDRFASELRKSDIPYESIYLGKISVSLEPRYLRWSLNAIVHFPTAYVGAARHLSAFRPDVVLVYNRDAAFLLHRLFRRYRTVFHLHELADGSKLSRWLYSVADSCVCGYIAVSEAVRRRLPALGIPAERTVVIHNGIPTPATRQPATRATSDRLRIGIVGQIGEWKGHDLLVRSVRELRDRGHAVECHVFGTGRSAYVEGLTELAHELGITRDMHFHGFVDEQSRIFGDLDVVVVPSRFDDPLPLSAIEAAMWGLPVVASDRGGLPEIVVHGRTGFCVDVSNSSGLTHALERLAADDGLRRDLGIAARARAERMFSETRMIDAIDRYLTHACRDARHVVAHAGPAPSR